MTVDLKQVEVEYKYDKHCGKPPEYLAENTKREKGRLDNRKGFSGSL